MSASLTVRRCVSSESPTCSSSKCFRNGCADQAAAAACGELERFVEIVARHQRADRAEGLDLVHDAVAQRVAAQQQRRREEGAFGHALALQRQPIAFAAQRVGVLHQRGHPPGHVGALALRRQRAHAHVLAGGVADDDLLQPGRACVRSSKPVHGLNFHAPFSIFTITRARWSRPRWSVGDMLKMPCAPASSLTCSNASRSAERNSGVPGCAFFNAAGTAAAINRPASQAWAPKVDTVPLP
jgi:hypothetical protein